VDLTLSVLVNLCNLRNLWIDQFTIRDLRLLLSDCHDRAIHRRKRSDSRAPRTPRGSARVGRQRLSKQICAQQCNQYHGREDTVTSIVAAFKHFEPEVADGEKPSAEVLETANGELKQIRVRVAGRIAAPPRVMGKAAFLHLSDGVSRLQIYVRRQDVTGWRNDAEGGEVNGWDLFALLDHGDFVGVDGYLFHHKDRRVISACREVTILSKSFAANAGQDAWHQRSEIRQRQRYAD
jgi:lysyl-tRNA synthetase class II